MRGLHFFNFLNNFKYLFIYLFIYYYDYNNYFIIIYLF